MIVGSETPGKNIFDRMQELNVPNVSVAVISEGGVAWTREYDLASRTAHDSSSLHPGVKPAVFQAGSISKSINAVLAMKVLVESGLVELDEKLLYFPKTGVPNIFNGCDLHVMSLEYMSHCKMSDYKNSFIFLDQNTLFYVDNNSETHKVTLTDVEKLKQELNRVVDDQNPYTFHLTKQQVKEFITLNSDGEKFTLAQLLTHTAGTNVHGFPGYPSSTEKDSLPTTDQILAGNPTIKALDETNPNPPDRRDTAIPNSWPVAVGKPGEKYKYSGGGVTIVQKLIEDACPGETYAALAQRHIFGPLVLDMNSSTFERQLPGKTTLNIQKGHLGDGEVVKGDWRIFPELAAAGLWTTAEDLAKFSVAVNDAFHGKKNPLMSQETANAMLTLQPHSEDGLGFEIRGQGDSFRFSHAGSTRGYHADYVVFPNQNVGTVILTNGNNGEQLIQEIQAALADEYSWPARTCERKTPVILEESSARSVVGKFIVNVNDQDIELSPRVENGQLHLSAPLYGDKLMDLILTPTSQKEFVCVKPIFYKVVFSEDYNCMTLDMLDNSLPRNTKRSDVLTAEHTHPISADVHPTTTLLTSRVSSGILGKQHTDPAPAFDQQPDKSPGIKPPGGSSD